MEFGGYRVRVLDAGAFRLDGGGLFGVVPRTVWQRALPPDEHNRVRVSTTFLLLSGHGRQVIVETGWGDKIDARDREFYAIEQPGGILAVLAREGIDPAHIDAVAVTHLHFDHGGGLTTLDRSGRAVPAFPNAGLFVQSREWHDATGNLSHMKTTYRAENFQPIADAGLLELVDGPARVLPNIRVEPTPGHTAGSQSILIGSDEEGTLAFVGDLVATAHHLRPYWTMGYDIEPATTIRTRRELVERAIAGRWVLVFPHDTACPAVRVGVDERGRWMSEPATTE